MILVYRIFFMKVENIKLKVNANDGSVEHQAFDQANANSNSHTAFSDHQQFSGKNIHFHSIFRFAVLEGLRTKVELETAECKEDVLRTF